MDEDDSFLAEAANKPLPSSDSSPSQFPDHDLSRPSTAYRVSRRAPETFEDEDISTTTPTKEQFNNPQNASSTPVRSQHSPSRSEPQTAIRTEHNPPAGSPLARHNSTSAPEANHDEDHSALPGNDSTDSFAEQAVRKHLQEIESSFAIPLSPLQTLSRQGIDDTFLFDSPSKKPKNLRPGDARSPLSRTSSIAQAHQDEPSLPTIANRDDDNQTPRIKQETSSDGRLNTPDNNPTPNTSSLEAFSSSPSAAAAAARSATRELSSRAESNMHEQDYGNSSAAGRNNSSLLQPDQHADDSILHAAYTSANTSGSMSHDNSDLSLPKINIDAGGTPGNALKGGTRPKYLRSRMTSHRSSSSSFTDDLDSDVTTGTAGTAGLGVDYALQSGGAIPALGITRSMSNILTRQISMGSMASDFRGDSTGRVGLEPMEPMEEDENEPINERDNDHLRTPRAPRQSLAAPTDTVIARHVRNVQVPESLAREYKTKSGFVTPHRKLSEVNLGASTTSTRAGRNLTLKEQSSTIERLSKENFDLKLKVMFLSDRLDKLSEEGIKEMISENVELKTSLAVIQRDNKVLRRRVKELEKQQKEEDNRPGTARSAGSSNGQTANDADPHANEEELYFLRERIDEFVTEIERLKEEVMSKEAEKRRMAEIVKSLQVVHERSVGDSLGHQDETDVWKDLYSQETARREQADEDNRKLRDEMFRMKQEMAPGGSNAGSQGGILHTTNIYNITKKPRNQSPTRPVSGMSGDAATLNGGMSVSSTLVDELRRESEQLRHENAELRREVGAQTSMLTSRNREKERLYQEIEDLKMAQRRGTASSTIDSILDRSASRAGARPQSRASAGTRATTTLEEPEREELETKMAELRDKLNQVKMQNQDLQREVSACMEDFEAEMEARKQAETVAHQLEDELQGVVNDLMTFQQERDEALQENSVLDHEFQALQKEAQDEIDALEGEADQKDTEIARLTQELTERNENQDALQEEMRKLSDVLLRFEDQQDQQLRKIKELETELADANKELEELEAKLVEANDKAQRLSVQQESSQGEIAFLREEQEGDKIRIGELEASIDNAEQAIREEKDRVKELDNRLQTERRQREIVANQEKEDVQQFVNQLNREMSAAKDESRKLRKNLSKQEVEAAEWKERLLELESNLREALGDLNGTRSSFLRDITKLQHDLENTCRELDSARSSVMEKDRIIKQRDELLESHALETHKIAEMLAKEQQFHRNTKHQFETFQKTSQHVHRNMSSAEVRINELENAKNQDKQRIAKLESTLKEQLNERNSLLLVLWTRLSSLCGTDWAHNNSLINGRALPSLEAVANMLPGFSKNLLAAVKTIEGIVGQFQGRIQGVEKQLWREYENLENSLDSRIKKLDKIEAKVRNGLATGTIAVSGSASQAMLEETRQRMSRLEDAYRQLKVENASLRSANEIRYESLDPNDDRDIDGGSPSPSIPTGPRDRAYRSGERSSSSSQRRVNIPVPTSRGRESNSRTSTMTRSRTESTLLTTSDMAMASDMVKEDQLGYHGNDAHSTHSGHSGGGNGGGGGDMKWMHRLKDLELKLKAEREGRLMDRNEASKKILTLEEVALQAQAREAKIERRRKMEAAAAAAQAGNGSGLLSRSGTEKRSPGNKGAVNWGLRGD